MTGKTCVKEKPLKLNLVIPKFYLAMFTKIKINIKQEYEHYKLQISQTNNY